MNFHYYMYFCRFIFIFFVNFCHKFCLSVIRPISENAGNRNNEGFLSKNSMINQCFCLFYLQSFHSETTTVSLPAKIILYSLKLPSAEPL